MTTRREYDASRARGKPRYFYHFFRSTEDWFYTNNRTPLSYAGSRYDPLEISHTAIERGSEDNPGAVTITVPEDCALAVSLKSGDIPTPVSVRISLIQADALDDAAIIFNGELQGGDFEDDVAKIRAVPLQSRFSRSMPRGKWQKLQCVWNTFRPGCDLSPTSFTHVGSVTAINGLTVTVSGTAAFAGTDASYFTLGVLTFGEHEVMIEEQSGDDVRLQHMISSLIVGSSVSLLAGDDRLAETCRDKFNNIERHLAFKYMPIVNPHYGQGLRN